MFKMSGLPRPIQTLARSRGFRRLVRHRAFGASVGVLATVSAVAIGASLIATHDPLAMSVKDRFTAPFHPDYLLGTDHLGRDLLSRLVYGAQVSLRIGFLVAAVSGLVGTLIGGLAGYFRALDGLLMRTMDALMAFPAIMLAIAIAASLGASEWNVVLALSSVYVPVTARIVRASVLSVRDMNFVEAAIAAGTSPMGTLIRHVLPNSLAPLIVQVSFVFAYAVLAEAALSFLGVGAPPPTPSWGSMIADGRSYIREAPWISIIPGLMVTVTVLALNRLGDALRDALDPKLKREDL